MVSVPCNGCTVCCKNDIIFLYPESGDDVSSYETAEAWNPFEKKDQLALARKENGDCFYLGENGCKIHDRAPAICKTFDCRGFVRQLEKTTRKKLRSFIKAGGVSKAILKEGRKRLHTL